MRFQNKDLKNKIAYLAALSLVFNYLEMLLPKFIPFFRLGLGNIVILLGLELNFASFLLLNIIKIVSGAILSGTLFTPFFLISFAQGFCSAITMFALSRLCKRRELLSLFGISMAGSAISAVVQVLTSSLYLGKATIALLGPMLLFSIISGCITAWLSGKIRLPAVTELEAGTPAATPNASAATPPSAATPTPAAPAVAPAIVISILCSILLTSLTESLWVFLGMLAVALVFQLCCGRKLFVLPHLGMWLFLLVFSFFTPNGKVIYEFWSVTLTTGALSDAVRKALRLSVIMMLSQGAATFNFAGKVSGVGEPSLLELTFAYFKKLSQKYGTKKSARKSVKKGITLPGAITVFVVFAALFILSAVCF